MSNDVPDFLRQDLLRRFKHAALVAHFGYEDEDRAMQRAGITAVQRTIKEFDVFGPEARLALIPLLEDPDPGIRVFAARHLLGKMPERALAVLKDIRERCPTEAHMTAASFLRDYEKGELKL